MPVKNDWGNTDDEKWETGEKTSRSSRQRKRCRQRSLSAINSYHLVSIFQTGADNVIFTRLCRRTWDVDSIILVIHGMYPLPRTFCRGFDRDRDRSVCCDNPANSITRGFTTVDWPFEKLYL